MAAQAIGSLYAMLGLDTAAFDAGIANARKKLGEFGKVNFSGALKAGFGELDDMLKGAAGQAGALGNVLAGLGITGAAAGAAIAVAFAGARDAMAFGDEIADTANKLRVTTDYLQEMRFVAHQLGGDFKDADEALAGFGKTLGLARSGLSAKAVKPFTALGLDPQDFTTVEAGLKAVTAKIAGLSNAAEQAAIADKLGLTPLLPAIREGTSAIDDMRQAAQTIGYVMDAQLIEKAGAANDEYEALTKVLDVQFKSAMVEAIPLVMKLTEMMVGGAKAAGWFAERLDDAAKFGAMIGSLDPFAQADIQEAKKYDAERKRRMAAAKADFMQPGARGTASSLSGWLGTGKEDPATQLTNIIDAQAKASAAARASAKAERDTAAAARERAAALKEIADAMRAAEDRSADYAASLLEEITTMGMSSDAIKRQQIALEAAAAPTAALAKLIRELGDEWLAKTRVAQEWASKLKTVNDQQGETITLFDALGVTIPTAMENAAYELDRAAEESRRLRYNIEDVASAINNADWTSALSGLARVLAQVQVAWKNAANAKDKYNAVASVAGAVGGAIGGTAGSAIGGAAAGAQLGTMIAPGIGTAIGAVIGGIGGLLGGSSAKKKAREQAAAQAAAAEAQRQQQINDTTFGLNVALLEAQGRAGEALAMTRQRELDALAKLDPSLVALQQQLFDLEDVANATAKAAEEQARWAAEAAKAQADQQKITIDLMAMDDAVTGGNSALLAARQLELATLDPASRALKEIYFARLDEGEALAKQAAAAEAAAKAQEDLAKAQDEAAKADFDMAQAYQTTNIGLMRQLMAMDDAVLGTTSARDAARADELAKLDATGKYLQKIVWARQDEAEVIAKQNEAMAKAAELLKQRADLENQLLVALGMTALATERQRTAMLESLDPSLRGYQTLLYGVEDATAAVTAAESALADARSAASQAYERETSAVQATIDKFKSFSASLKSFRGSLDTGGLAMNDPMTQYARTKADFERVAGLAASGNEDALGSLQGVSEAYLEASKNAQATNVGYFKDLAAVKRATEAAQKYADQQVDQGTAQLNALNAQVSALGILNQSTLSVGQAVTNVASAIDALARATAAKSAADAAAKQALSSAGVIPKASESIAIAANDNADLAAAKAIYLSATGGISSELFNRYVGSNPFATFNRLGYEGDPEALRKKYGFATGGSFTVGGSGPPDSQVFPLHLSPGEMVNVSRPGQGGNAELVAELRALRQEVAELKAAQIQTTINTGRQVRLAERWDGDGLPETRSVA